MDKIDILSQKKIEEHELYDVFEEARQPAVNYAECEAIHRGVASQ